MADHHQIMALNMTNFFNRELMMYSFGDIKFKKPISLKVIAYTLAFLILWTLPLLLVFGLPLDPFRLVLYLVPPFALGQLAVRPMSIFGDRTLIDFVRVAFRFLGEPRGWADMDPFDPNTKSQTFTMEHEIWISRRREYALLAELIDEEQRASRAMGKSSRGAKAKKTAKQKVRKS